MTALLGRLRLTHRSRLMVHLAGYACLAAFVGVVTAAGSPPETYLVVLLVAVLVHVLEPYAGSAILPQSAAVLLWFTSQIPHGTWWSLPAGLLLLGHHLANALATTGPEQAALSAAVCRAWCRPVPVVVALSLGVGVFVLLLATGWRIDSVLLPALSLTLLAGGLVVAAVLRDRRAGRQQAAEET